MTTDKSKITLTVPADEAIRLENGETIYVKPFLDISDMIILLSLYMGEFFQASPNHIIQAETKMILGILDLCTNIDTRDDFSLRAWMSNHKLLETIKSKIRNYGEFRAWLKVTIEEKKEEKRLSTSTGSQIEYLISYLQNLQDVKISGEDINNAKSLIEVLSQSGLGKAIQKLE